MTTYTTTLESVVEDIKAFYKPDEWHFLTLNGIDTGEGELLLQWIFSKYNAVDEVVMFTASTPFDALIPSISSVIPSSTMSERETVDMFGVTIQGAQKGLYLDEDSKTMPLRCST